MWRVFALARYPKKVVIESPRSLAECEAALARITRTPMRFNGRNGPRPFVGWVRHGRGRMWFSRRTGLSSSARALQFTLVSEGAGCRLEGELEVVRPIRWFTGFYLIFLIVLAVQGAVERDLAAHRVLWLHNLQSLFISPLFGLAFMYGYQGLGVLFSGRSERLANKIITYVMRSPESENIVRDLLDSSR